MRMENVIRGGFGGCIRGIAFAVCMAVGLVAGAAETVALGDWKVTGWSGGCSLSYRGKTLARISSGYWQPGYRVSCMDGSVSSIKRTGENVVILSRTNGYAALELKVECSARSARVTLDADFRKAAGPFEYEFAFPVQTYSTGSAGVPFVRLDGQALSVYEDEAFPARWARCVRFDLPDAAYELRTMPESTSDAFVFQDRRKDGKGNLRHVLCRKVDVPMRQTFVHELSIDDGFDAATLERRARRFARPADTKLAVPFDNPGFEDDGGWSCPGNAHYDGSVAHTGSRSMCLSVTGAKGDGVYVTRRIPVIGGAQYRAGAFIKTEDVKDGKVGNKEPVGAGVIVEWCDKSGKWLSSGAYATGRYGTSDWKRERTCWVAAPADAGFATVFMTLRGTGRAWFDDVVFERRIVSYDKVEPADGCRLESNTPHFAWRMWRGVRRYQLELSRDESFPKGQVKVCEVGGLTEFQLEEPLDEGRWFWRIGVNGVSDDIPYSFTVAVPKDRDTLPPQVLSSGARVTSANEPFTVRVKDAGAQRPSLTFLGVKGECRTSGADGVHVYSFAAPQSGWPHGLTKEDVTAVDASGNSSVRSIWLLNAAKPANGTKIDAKGRFTVADRPFFPLGIYEVAEKEMPTVRAAGFDVVHSYRWEGSSDNAACAAYLDACWRTDGLRAFIGFDRKTLVAGDFASLAQRVAALASHPGLFCWYLIDEPEHAHQFVSPDLLVAYAELIRALDPYHAVVVTTWGNAMSDYRRSWDTHWTQAYGDPAGVVRMLDEHRGYLKGRWESPITLLVNSNDSELGRQWRKGITPDPDKYSKDYSYLRACAMLALPERCNGVFWWWYAPATREYFTVAQTPRGWADLKRVLKELRDLRPVIDAEGTVLTGRVGASDAPVCWWAKTVEGDTTFVAVNTANAPVEVEVAVPGFKTEKLNLSAHETHIGKLRP